MVVFTCNHCGDSLQKPRVEKHYNFVCRTTKSLTCIDCLKDFRGEEYVSHTKCLTEEERYAAKGAYANGIVKKGEVKQESWLEMIRSIIEKETNLRAPIRNLLNTISNYSNVPRKKPKFMNFIKSSSGGRGNFKEVEEVWDIIEKYKADQQKAKEQINVNPQEVVTEKNNGVNDNSKEDNKDRKKKKKAKLETNMENGENNSKLVQESKKSKKRKNNETNTEEIIGTEQEHVENKVKNGKKSKKSQIETISTEIDDKLINEATENVKSINGNDKIENNELKRKSKKKKIQNGENEVPPSSKKSKLDIINENNSLETAVTAPQMDAEDNFDFTQKIIEILNSKGTLSLKKLEKKVINAYLKHFGLSECSPKIVKKYNKKLKKIEIIEVVDDKVTIKT